MNDLYRHIKVPVNTPNPDLHIYRFSDFTDASLMSMPAHTKSFHQVSFITGFGSSQLNINQEKIKAYEAVLYFISPHHVYSWARDLNIDGYILNFKQDYLPFKPHTFQELFKFFDLSELNAIPIDKDQVTRVREIFEELYSHYHKTPHKFSHEILKHYTQVLLYKCLELYEVRKKVVNELPENQNLFIRFQNFINNYYHSKRTIKEYADLLNITANHLSESIKKSTGKNALYYINQRLLLEAKNMLQYGDDDIKQIAYTLDFASPSHFGKFFKKNTSKTPLEYRKTIASEK